MCAVQWVLLKSCIFGLCISVTEAGVVLATFDGKNTYSIGSEVELVCSITPYNNEMTWFVNNDPYADCIVGTCNPYSNKPYAFSFTFNETAGVFKLAIGSVTYSHADLSFACDDGIERKQISFNVTAVTNEGNGDNDNSELSIGAIVGIVLGCVVGLSFLCVVVFAVFLRCTRKKKGTIEQNDAAQNYGGNGTETVQEQPNALTYSVGESSIGPKDGIEVGNGTEIVQEQPNALTYSVGESSIGPKDGIEVNQLEMKNNILVWMTDVNKFFILMKETIEVLSAMKVHQKTKLWQKIEKEIQKLQKIKEEEVLYGTVTNKAKREQLLKKEQELIEKSKWTKEQVDIISIRNTYGDEEQKRDIKTLHGLIKDEDNEGKCVLSSFIMQVLQEDKAAYDKIKQGFQIEKPKDGRKKRKRRPNQQ